MTLSPWTSSLWLACGLFVGLGGSQGRSPKLEPGGAFFAPADALDQVDDVLVKAGGIEIRESDFARYLRTRATRRILADLVFDRLVAAECKRRKIAGSAPALARALARRQLKAEGATKDREREVRVMNEILLEQRGNALVRAARRIDDAALRERFDQVYGVDGHKVEVQHILVAFPATARRLQVAGNKDPKQAEIEAAAKERASGLSVRLAKGANFASLLGESDDPTTQSLLADPRFAAKAGFIEGYNYQRYGSSFASEVRRLGAGETSKPLRTSHGFHLIRVVARKTTKLADVAERLRRELRQAPANRAELEALRRRLFERHGVRLDQ